MDEVREYKQKILDEDKSILARVRRLQKDEKLSFEDAVKIVQISMLDDIIDRIDYGVKYPF